MRLNCAGCPKLKETRLKGRGFPVFSCGSSGKIVPQEVTTQSINFRAVFFRVPEFCPLSDDLVERRADKAPQKTWTTVTVR